MQAPLNQRQRDNMPYVDKLFEERRSQVIKGSTGPTPDNVRSGSAGVSSGFADKDFEQRRSQIISQQVQQPVQKVSTTPTPAPATPNFTQQPSSILSTLGTFKDTIQQKIRGIFTPAGGQAIEIKQPLPKEFTMPEFTPDQMEKIGSLKVGQVVPGFESPVSAQSGQIKKGGKFTPGNVIDEIFTKPANSLLNDTGYFGEGIKKAASNLYNDPIGTLVPVFGMLEKDPKIGPKIKESAPYEFTTSAVQGLIQGPLRVYANWNPQVQSFLDQEVESVGKKGDAAIAGNTVGNIIGTIGSFVLGGEVVQALKFGKTALPLTFAALGQTSLPANTPAQARLRNAVIDAVSGTLLEYVKPLANLQKMGMMGRGVEYTKQLAKSLGILSTQTYLDARSVGASDEQAKEMVKDSAIILLGLHGFMIAGKAGQYATRSNFKEGSAVFTPTQAREAVIGSNLEKTKLGETILKYSFEAESMGKNLKIDMTAAKKSKIAGVLNLKTPEGIAVTDISYVDAIEQPKLGTAKGTTEKAGTSIIPENQPQIGAEVAKPKAVENLNKAIAEYRMDQGVNISPKGEVRQTATLQELTRLSGDPEVVATTQEQVSKLPVDENGDITLYRVGTIREGDQRLISASFDKQAAETFKQNFAESFGVDRPITEIKVKPEDIKIFMGGDEKEVLIQNNLGETPVEKLARKQGEISNKIRQDALSGKSENQRLTSPDNIKQANIPGLDLANATPETKIELYRAGVGEIEPGDFITSKANAEQNYLPNRPGTELQSKTIALKDLIFAAKKSEFIYAPEVKKPETIAEVTPKEALPSPAKMTTPPKEIEATGGQKAPVRPSRGVVSTPEEINKPLREIYKTADQDKLGQAQYEVWTELEIAEAGGKIFAEGENSTRREFVGYKSSTFPQWVPEELRRRDLFDKVMGGISDLENITYPDSSTPRLQRLYDAILGEIDSRTGIDTSSIREKITKEYETQKQTKPQKTVRRSVTRSGRTETKTQEEQALEVLKRTVGNIFEKVEPVSGLWESKGNVIHVRPLRENTGFADRLRQFDNIEKVQDAGGNNVYRVVIKKSQIVKPKKSSSGILGFNPKNLKNPFSSEAKVELNKIVKQSEIAKTLSDKLLVPIRRGKFRHGSAIGIYKPGEKVVRIKRGGLQTVFHEVAHFLDDTIGFSKNIDKVERKKLMQEYGAEFKGQPNKQRKEAFAEYLRFRMTGQTEKIAQWSPKFDKEFTAKIEQLPEIKAVIDTATADFKRWNEQPAVSKVLSHIAVGETGKAPFKERLTNSLHNLYTGALDDLHPLSEFSNLAKEKLGTVAFENDPYVLARNLRGWVGKAELFLNKGTFGKIFWKTENGKTKMNFNGKSYSEIMKPIEKAGKLDDFRAFIVAQRIVNDLAPREIITGIDVDDAKKALEELSAKNPEFEAIAKERRDYKDRLLEFASDNGLVGEEGLKKMKEANKYHVPFYRVMEESNAKFLGKSKIAGNIASPIKKIKGSEREIIDPLESDVKDTYAIINAAERNNIGVAMANLSKMNFELGRLFEEVAKPMKGTKVSVKEVMKEALKGTGAEEIPLPEDLAETTVTLFRPTYASGPNMLNVNMGDKQLVFEVDPDLFKAIQGLNTEDVGTIMKLLSVPAKLLRAGATLSPDFSVRNPLRDQFTAFVFSKYGFTPGVDLVKGMFELWKKEDVYNLWKAGGGEHAMFVSMDRENLQQNLEKALKDPSIKSTIVDIAKNPLLPLQLLSELGEAGTRLGEMRNALERGANPIEAALASRNITLDFSRIGTTTKAINSIIPFTNANIQATDSMIRNFKKNPMRSLFKAFLGLTLPSILLYLANRKDPRWKEIPQWQKNIFWIVFTPEHTWRIPKPFELGSLFASIPERILETIDTKDPEILDELWKTVADGFTPGMMPTVLGPAYENMANYSFFYDRPIVSRGKENLPPAQQYGPYTTEFSKILGEALNTSPAKLDNLINGYTGGLGKYAVQGIDAILKGTGTVNPPVAPAKTLEEMPVIKAFMIKNPIGSSSESVNKIYVMYEKENQKMNYAKQLVKEGKMDEAKTYLQENPSAVNAIILTGTVDTFSEMTKAISIIRDSRNLTAEEKKTKIDAIGKLQTELAQKVLQQIKATKKK